MRYSRTREEATEVMNDGFIKIFAKLHKYSRGLPFKSWIRKVMINSSIDCFRRNEKHYHALDISHGHYESLSETVIEKLSEQEILQAIQQLPPSYKMVFNLFAIEGYKHSEIANMLNISEGTSKSNLAIARNKLQKILNTEQERLKQERNG